MPSCLTIGLNIWRLPVEKDSDNHINESSQKSNHNFGINELGTFNYWGPPVFIESLITIYLTLWPRSSLVSLGHPWGLGLCRPGPGLSARLMT